MASTKQEAMKFKKKPIIEYITSRHQKDGGFHFANTEPSGGADTYYALEVLNFLNYQIPYKEDVKQFLESFEQDKESFDFVGLFFTARCFQILKLGTSMLADKFNMLNPIKKFDLKNTNKKLFVESVSSLKNSFIVTATAKTLDIKLSNKAIRRYVISHKNADNGFGRNRISTIPDTYFALATLQNIGLLNISTDTKDYLSKSDNIPSNYLEYVYWHFSSSDFLNFIPAYTDKLINYLNMCKRSNGGFSRSPFQGIPTFEDTFYAVSILKILEKITKKELLE